ncbi:hypothetical protein DSAG12_00924 [Promethearchaeum syntrophicum]|uniref:Uncharacterized protein n=1 Tax=Promethearchaeum syntrophicum TaxID=2594042 RepID=A0A5B9D7U4_9ARCH|nr:hypothetical protein [Candidatus Prometheoarchaeum syntrophicum]QEE15101.1 hypothetical protein DSAG12_00924 [Candidatus Prometheoarchaeum syntrophicum]
MFRKTKSNLSRIVRQKELELKSAKIERELIKLFNNYVKTSVLAEIHALDDSTQLLNVINIGKRFQKICDSIGNTPDYKKMFNFLSDVRMRDREISRLVTSMKIKYGFNNPEKFRVEHEILGENLDFILQSLKSQYKSLQQEENEIKLAKQQKKEEKEKIKLDKKQDKQIFLNLDVHSYIERLKISTPVQKVEKWAQSKFHPDKLEENKLKIKNYRKNVTENKEKKFQKDLTLNEERTLLKNWIKEFREILFKFESNAYFNHIIDYSNAFLKFNEVLDVKFKNNPQFEGKTSQLRSDLREFYKFLEDWIIRVNIKYENPRKKNPKEDTVNKKNIDEFLKKYELNRSKFIINQEDSRILKIIFKEEKANQKKLKAKERTEKKKQKDVINPRKPKKKKNSKEI